IDAVDAEMSGLEPAAGRKTRHREVGRCPGGGEAEQQIGADLVIEAAGGADRAVAGVEATDHRVAAQRLRAAGAGPPSAPTLRPERAALGTDRGKGFVLGARRLLVVGGIPQQRALRAEVVAAEPAPA